MDLVKAIRVLKRIGVSKSLRKWGPLFVVAQPETRGLIKKGVDNLEKRVRQRQAGQPPLGRFSRGVNYTTRAVDLGLATGFQVLGELSDQVYRLMDALTDAVLEEGLPVADKIVDYGEKQVKEVIVGLADLGEYIFRATAETKAQNLRRK